LHQARAGKRKRPLDHRVAGRAEERAAHREVARNPRRCHHREGQKRRHRQPRPPRPAKNDEVKDYRQNHPAKGIPRQHAQPRQQPDGQREDEPPALLGVFVAAVVLVTAFILWERKASEPILPPSLFRVGIFRVSAGVSFLMSIVMFGAIIYLPLYLQLVDGVSAMVSGLLLVPMMVGLLVTSIASGQIVTRPGRYKVFPIVGTVLMVIGMWM